MYNKTVKQMKENLVSEMVDNGYKLFNETIEEFAERFTLEDIVMFNEKFMQLQKEVAKRGN